MIATSEIRLNDSLLEGTIPNVTIEENLRAGGLIGVLTGADSYQLIDDAGGAVFLDGNQLRLTEGAVLDDAGMPILRVTLLAIGPLGPQEVTAVIEVLTGDVHEVLRGTPDGETLEPANPGRDFILPGGGDDTIQADGSDIIVLTGQRSDYQIDTVFIEGEAGGGYGGGGYGDGYGGTYETTITDLRAGAPDGIDLVKFGTLVTLRFSDGDYVEGDASLATTTAALTLDGRVLEEHKFIPENAAPGEIGQLGLRGQPGALPILTQVEVLAFIPGQTFPEEMDLDSSPFAIDEFGVLSLKEPLDAEAVELYSLRIFYTDAAGQSGFEVVRITPMNLDDAPELVAGPGVDRPYLIQNYTDLSSNLLLGTLGVDDQDGTTGEVTFVLGGADADKFFVENGDLFLLAGTPINTGAPIDFDLTVTVNDSALPGSGQTVDLDIKVSRPNPLDSIRWDYVAPSDIKVFIQPGGVAISEDSLLFETPPGFVSQSFSAQQIAAIQSAFGLFSAVANLQFTFVQTLAEADFAMIAAPTIAGALADWTIAGGTLTAGGEAVVLDGWGRFNMALLGSSSFAPGTESFFALIHEIGHGLGLAHPHDTGGGSVIMEEVLTDFGSLGAFNLNQAAFTIMSYNRGLAHGLMGTPGAADMGHAAAPGALDIAVLQEKYGANTSTGAGRNTYDLDTDMVRAIWDNNGLDRIRYLGTGNAIIDLNSATLDYSVTGGGAVSYVEGARGALTIAHGVLIEEAQGGRGEDFLLGNAANNKLIGGAGNDWLVGGAGNDTLESNAGVDRLEGGDGIDTASYQHSYWRVSVDLELGRGRFGQAEGDTYRGIENVIGSGFGDRIMGDAQDNLIRGLDGDDTLWGREGNDVLLGGAGADRLVGGAGVDRASYTGSASGVQVDLGLGLGMGGDAAGDQLLEIENLSGSAHNDALVGDAADNWLMGSGGDDFLWGARGTDRLSGGAGADTFVFDLGFDRDQITDFGAGDLILFTAALWNSLGIDSFADLLSDKARQIGARVELTLSETDVLQLDRVQLADLTPDRFDIWAVIS